MYGFLSTHPLFWEAIRELPIFFVYALESDGESVMTEYAVSTQDARAESLATEVSVKLFGRELDHGYIREIEVSSESIVGSKYTLFDASDLLAEADEECV